MSSLNINDLFSVKDMVFVITGGGSGLGAMMAQALAANGASKVFILGRRQKSLEGVAAMAVRTLPLSHPKLLILNILPVQRQNYPDRLRHLVQRLPTHRRKRHQAAKSFHQYLGRQFRYLRSHHRLRTTTRRY